MLASPVFALQTCSSSHPWAHRSYWLLDLQPCIWTQDRDTGGDQAIDTKQPSFTQGQSLLSFYHSLCHLFLNLFLCKWSWSLQFLSFGFGAKHHILNFVLSPNALPLHLIMHPISIGNDLPWSYKCSCCVDSLLWVLCLHTGACVPQNHLPLCLCAFLGLWRWAFDGPLAPP